MQKQISIMHNKLTWIIIQVKKLKNEFLTHTKSSNSRHKNIIITVHIYNTSLIDFTLITC